MAAQTLTKRADSRGKHKPKKPKKGKKGRPPGKRGFVNQEATLLFNLAPRILRMLERFDNAFAQHPVTFSAIGAISRNVAGVPLKIMTGDRKDPQIIESGPWWALFERINPNMDQALFLEAIVVYLESPAGEVFIVLESKDDQRLKRGEIPFELWPLSGALFKPLFAKAANGSKKHIGWRFRDPETGGIIDYALHEVVQIRYFNPIDSMRGLGPARAAEMTARSDWKARLFDEAFLDNGANPGGWLMTDDDIDDDEYDQEISRFEDRQVGPTKAGRVMLLSGGKKFIPNPQTNKDMQMREKLVFDRDEILMVHGVPKSEVGIEQAANMITRAGRLSTNTVFWQGKLVPLMEKITRAIRRQLFDVVTGGDIWIEFDFDVIIALKPNLNESLDASLKAQSLGIPLNDIIEAHELPYPRQPHGDVGLIPAGFVPVDALDLPEDEFDFEDDDDLIAILEEDEIPEITDIDSLAMQRAREAVRQMMSKRNPAHDEAWFRIAAGVMDPMGSRIRARFRRYLVLLRAEQLKLLKKIPPPQTKASRDGSEGFLFDEERWNKRLKRAHRPLYVETALRSIDQADKEIDKEETERGIIQIPRRLHEGAVRVPKGRRPEIAKEIADRRVSVLVKTNRTIRRRIARQIERGIAEGETTRKIAKRIRSVFNSVSRKQSLVIARTEVSSIVNQARIETFIDRKQRFHIWVTARDEAVRATHARQDGMILEIGRRFPNGLRWPLDIGPPSEVVNCRCVTIPG